MKKLLAFLIFFPLVASSQNSSASKSSAVEDVLNQWHRAAAEAKYEIYISLMTDNAVFIGTDAEENWQMAAFITFAKPIFEKGKAWDFKTIERNIYFSSDGRTAWFDELLDTWMKICRGSGVLVKNDGQWKIAHYVLSMTIPNDVTAAVIKAKTPLEDKLLNSKSKK